MRSTVDLSIMHRAPNTVLQKFRCTHTYKAVRAHTRSRTCTCTRPSTRTRTRARTRICTCTCTHMRGYLNAHAIARVASACSGDHARCSAMSYCVLCCGTLMAAWRRGVARGVATWRGMTWHARGVTRLSMVRHARSVAWRIVARTWRGVALRGVTCTCRGVAWRGAWRGVT